ncbi:hypothetical protein F383_07437 [Gossypium arboreum]|uniref:Uncharacterized protein n=1 Tax=Gossypium arboreum TaxID=29729 RepID=A0A0B0MP70_GOSAR|nr:hypothetical protein F383_07437 [Gossypium arboreum]
MFVSSFSSRNNQSTQLPLLSIHQRPSSKLFIDTQTQSPEPTKTPPFVSQRVRVFRQASM